MNARSFWPPMEAAQIDYETLRVDVLERDQLSDDLAAARFARRGLAGLIRWPVSDPIFVAELVGASRPAWSPHTDPRLDALAVGYQFLLELAVTRQPESINLSGGAR